MLQSVISDDIRHNYIWFCFFFHSTNRDFTLFFLRELLLTFSIISSNVFNSSNRKIVKTRYLLHDINVSPRGGHRDRNIRKDLIRSHNNNFDAIWSDPVKFSIYIRIYLTEFPRFNLIVAFRNLWNIFSRLGNCLSELTVRFRVDYVSRL